MMVIRKIILLQLLNNHNCANYFFSSTNLMLSHLLVLACHLVLESYPVIHVYLRLKIKSDIPL